MPRIRTVTSYTLAIIMAVIWTGTVYASGATVYTSTCAGCHGITGKGDGVAAGYLYPRPRNFTLGEFKFGGTVNQIAQTVQRGLPGTAMPGFAASLTVKEINAVAVYVRRFVPGKAPPAFVPPSPPDGLGSATLGAAIYAEACVACHGSSGYGDGPGSLFLQDAAGNPIRPRNLVEESFAGGERPEDVYTRLHQGIPGTPMPAFGNTYSNKQLWDLVAFVKSLRKNRAAATNGPDAISAGRGTISAGLEDPAWANAPESVLTLNPLWRRSSWPASIKVRALASADTIAFRFSWPDTAPNRRQSQMKDFVDAVAVMFPENVSNKSPPPFIGLGSAGPQGAVRILQWRALSGPKGPTVASPRVYRMENPWDSKQMATPARAAGNPISAATTPAVMEYVASGVSTVTNVPSSRMRSEARWKNGRWQVFISRPRAGIASLENSSVWTAFAVWDGGAHDRNGQKSVTKWISLNLGSKK